MSLDGHLDVAVTDDAVEFAFTVTNVDTEPIDLAFRSGKRADITVYQDGIEVWRWSDGRMFTQARQTKSLAPGDSIVQTANWEDPVLGDYTVDATLESATVDLLERTAFEV